MNTILALHLAVRFALLIVMLVGLLKAGGSWLRGWAPERFDLSLASIFVGLFDLQALLGLLVILLGGLAGPLHPLVMLMALVFAHWIQSAIQRQKSRESNSLRVALYAVPLAIVLFGLAIFGRLPV